MKKSFKLQAKKFIDNTDDFFNFDQDLKIDSKHKKILNSSHDILKNNIEKFLADFRDWDLHGDFGCPSQLSALHLKFLGFKKILKNILKKTFFLDDTDFIRSFFDDIEMLKKTSSFDLLKENPVHQTPGCKDFFSIENTTTNYRWNRYAYQANRILSDKLLVDSNIFLNLGSFYGGLESFLFRKLPNVKYILVDFNHQLIRSYLFLKNLFPDSNHIYPNETPNINFNDCTPGFYYLRVQDFFKINNIKPHLFHNSFSLGEMSDEFFENYLNSQIFMSSKTIYLVNRFVSSPFFERTYKDNSKNIINYIETDNFKINYLDIFPIHHYQIIKRNLFKINAKRPISSPYFELIMKNENWR